MGFLNHTKHYIRDLFRYPALQARDGNYDAYWHHRDVASLELNSYQRERVGLILRYGVQARDRVLDIGCGDGRVLAALKKAMVLKEAIGLDSSEVALEQARAKGLSAIKGDLQDLRSAPLADVVMFLEVLEHVPNSEELLTWAIAHADRTVIFSVPNTGFIMHRLRLLMGRFPLQWRAHPSEHLRFWTMHDMRWWLDQLDYRNARIHTYEGIPVLNKLWPSLFAAGLLIIINK